MLDGSEYVEGPPDAGLHGEWETVDMWQGADGSQAADSAAVNLYIRQQTRSRRPRAPSTTISAVPGLALDSSAELGLGEDGHAGWQAPCPCCWQHQVEVAAGQQLTVQECYSQLDAEAILFLQNAGKLGRVRCHMWVDTPYRSVEVGPTELMQAYQYKCDGCPGEHFTSQQD